MKDEERSDDTAARAEDTDNADLTADAETMADAATAEAVPGEERDDDAAGNADTTAAAGSHTDSAPDTEEVAEAVPDGAAGTNADVDAEPTTPGPDIPADEDPPPYRFPVARARADVDLIVHINTLADLVDAMRRGDLVEVAGLGLVPADVAARLVKAAAARPSMWCMTLVDDDGRVVEHVRTQHDPTKAMRDFVNARDRHCRFPGCTVTAVRCDQDHTAAWEAGGATCPCNLTPLCRRHHRLKQAQGFALQVDAETNTATWTTPHTGHTTSPPWRYTPPDERPPPF